MPLSLKLTGRDELYLKRGSEHHLKTKLVETWSRWIIVAMNAIREDARYECYHVLTDPTSDRARWELIELDRQLASEWTRREWALLSSSSALEEILAERMEEYLKQIVKDQPNERLEEWMVSEYMVQRRKRVAKERTQAKERMEKEMKISEKRAEREGWPWRDQDKYLNPRKMWEAGQKFISEQWEDRGMGLWKGRSRLEEKHDRSWDNDDEDLARLISLKPIRSAFKHWQRQRVDDKKRMDTTIDVIRKADLEDLDTAYRYPNPSKDFFKRFIKIQDLLEFDFMFQWNLTVLKMEVEEMAKFCSATVYDMTNRNENIVCIENSTTYSVINCYDDSVPKNDHLLFLSPQEPQFIQENREQWWRKQRSNSSTFYFSPESVSNSSDYVHRQDGTIAHIFIFIQSQTRVRLSLLHFRSHEVSASVQENNKALRDIPTDEPPERLQLQKFELEQFEPGRHHLELVVKWGGYGSYGIRNIFVEFYGDSDLADVGSERFSP